MKPKQNFVDKLPFKKVFIVFFIAVFALFATTAVYGSVTVNQLRQERTTLLQQAGAEQDEQAEVGLNESGEDTDGEDNRENDGETRGMNDDNTDGEEGAFYFGREGTGRDGRFSGEHEWDGEMFMRGRFEAGQRAELRMQIPTGFKVLAAVWVLMFALYWLLCVLWTYANARKYGQNVLLWTLAVLFTNLLGILIYLLVRGSVQKCPGCNEAQSAANEHCTCCGAALKRTCAKCGAPAVASDTYCKKCGAPLAAVTAPAPSEEKPADDATTPGEE